MARHRSIRSILPILLIILMLYLIGNFVVNPKHVNAEGNEPTNTPIPTATATQTIAIVPSDTPLPSDAQLEDKSLTQPDVSFDDNAVPLPPSEGETQSSSLMGSLGSANLCLIGAIVIGTIIVVVMVVFGVIQRIRPES
jgi:hypothetical protein